MAIEKQHIDYIDPDDWDERPENICKTCGYKLCICARYAPVSAVKAKGHPAPRSVLTLLPSGPYRL